MTELMAEVIDCSPVGDSIMCTSFLHPLPRRDIITLTKVGGTLTAGHDRLGAARTQSRDVSLDSELSVAVDDELEIS